jgi:hypothetical protein
MMAEAEPYCHAHQLPRAVCRCPASRGDLATAELTIVDWERLEDLADQAMNEDSPPFQAQWPGTCHACGQRWEPGDMVAWSADDDELAHASCTGDD